MLQELINEIVVEVLQEAQQTHFTKLNDKTRSWVKLLFLRNLSREEISDRTGVPFDYVRELFKDFAEEVRISTPTGKLQDKVKEMHKQGFHQKRLSAIFRIPLHTIEQWVGRDVVVPLGKSNLEREVGNEKLPSFQDIFNSRHNKP